VVVILAAEKSRPVMWHLTSGLEIVWYTLATISVVIFAYGVIAPMLRYRGADRTGMPPLRELPMRIARAGRLVVTHETIAQRKPVVGWAHRAIFYGWITLFAGTVIVALDTDLTGPVFGVHFFHGNFYLACKAALNILGTALIAGLLVMMIRRAVVRPIALDDTRADRTPGEAGFDHHRYRVGDWVFVVTLLVIAVTGFLLEAVRISMDSPGYGVYQFGGWLLAQPLAGALDQSQLGDLRIGLWWFHGLLAISFVAAIPYTKAAHMLTSFASLVVRDPDAKRRLRGRPPELAAHPDGYGTLADLSALHLLHLDACTRCGRCHEVCPATATGQPLSPRDVVLQLHDEVQAVEPSIGGVLGLLRERDMSLSATPVIGHDRVRVETVWACMQCNACVEVCPVGIEQAPIINGLRRGLVEQGDLAPTLQTALEAVGRVGNSFGRAADTRPAWTKDLDFPIKDARREPVDVLWFVGDYASFDERSQDVTRTTARLFHAAGLDFGILYESERNSGNDVRRVGEEGLFENLADGNITALRAASFGRIVTTDPHSLNTLRNEYPQRGGGPWEVVHHTQQILELIEQGELDVREQLDYAVTYHDPCHLGRLNGEYEAPRRILELLGCRLVEMPRNRANSFCCGAGGGRIWMPDTVGTERPSENRIHEAIALGDLDFFVVACPKDVTMYDDAIRTTGNDGRIALRELTELVAEALDRALRPAAST
jgi:Fe-S oxidoreductase